jgi:sirohydrochlorin cobaltochelatase
MISQTSGSRWGLEGSSWMVNSDDARRTRSPVANDASLELEELESLISKINAMLPPQYQNCFDDIRPVSMGSAGLKYGPDGKVAWDEIWTSFCDLAIAGGPPHRGKLLEPVSAEEALSEPDKYQQVVEEIGRGICMITRLPVLPRLMPGWIGLRCDDETMAAWLVRAIVAENVIARQEQTMLYLPAGPHFRLEKAIKNVVTVVAKTCHYWNCHMPAAQRALAAAVMNSSAANTGLLQPSSPAEVHAALPEYQSVVRAMERGIQQATSLQPMPSHCLGWVGIGCADVAMAVWLMRAVIVENILVRREANALYLPASPRFTAEDIHRIMEAICRAWRLWNKRDHGSGPASSAT